MAMRDLRTTPRQVPRIHRAVGGGGHTAHRWPPPRSAAGRAEVRPTNGRGSKLAGDAGCCPALSMTHRAARRHHCYELQIGAGHFGWYLWTQDKEIFGRRRCTPPRSSGEVHGASEPRSASWRPAPWWCRTCNASRPPGFLTSTRGIPWRARWGRALSNTATSRR